MDNELVQALTLACQATITAPWLALAVAVVTAGFISWLTTPGKGAK